MTTQPQGDWQKWNELWPRIAAGDNAMLYTPDEPKSRGQLSHRLYFDALWKLLESDTSGKFLEMGAGRGTTSQYLAAHKADVTLLDLSKNGFDLARKNWEATGFGEPTCVEADVTATGLESDSYRCIYSVGLLEHFDDPLPVLKETARLLQPDGFCFHVIIDGQSDPGDMNRKTFDADQWIKWSQECGMGDVIYQECDQAGVHYLIAYNRATSPALNRWCSESGGEASSDPPGSLPERKICIVGTAPSSCRLAPFKDESWEIWGLSTHPNLPRITRWYELHDFERKRSQQPKYWDWLKENQDKVWSDAPHSELPDVHLYDRDEVYHRFQADYFRSSIDYMIAHAIMEIEKNGYNGKIALYGVDMAQDLPGIVSEYAHQRPSCEYWIGVCRGPEDKPTIPMFIPAQSDLMKVHAPYAFDTGKKPTWIKLRVREQELRDQRQGFAKQKREMTCAVHRAEGALRMIEIICSNGIPDEVKKEIEAMRPKVENERASQQSQMENATQLLNGADGAISMFPYIQQSLV